MNHRLSLTQIRLICFAGYCLILLLLYSTAAPAQDRLNRSEGFSQERIVMMAQELDLTEDQRKALLPIMQRYGEETRAMLENHGVDLKAGERPPVRKLMAMRSDAKKNRAAFEKDVAGVLSPVQMEEFKKLQDNRRADMRARLRVSQ
ncbi:Spy/CpxP family protein refolding chaperone [Hoeflea prorocentri]|uniref:Spy/CpxP family protein refolding chaperone n=1 Tax=Hoeflea prorocentri TaxID=1922333 RepID=A0A9X3UME0_9HYPH|nr:Spy/CpxP family protein refolding chaperone [Hoeflea prorocentri]MCY6381741.1 Spy/CpxP family protein refolding chaperone [Hoeflea prorocentri]MDA5399541.1 Spy/CpxP family protein refolding chaperone [Hoeflea prorocentri]